MQISDLVNQFTGNRALNKKNVNNTVRREAPPQTASKGNQAVASLQKGQIFEGSVTQMKNGKVVLSLSNGDTVTARMSGDVPISEGESVFFEVKSNEGNLVNIHPVSVGASSNPILLSALSTAGLAQNEKNLQMVDSMMKEQLPIDSKSLDDMAQVMAEHPDTDMDTLLTMKKAGIPLTDDMIQQFSNYRESEGAMLDTVSELLDGMSQAFASDEVTASDVTQFAKNLMYILTTKEGVLPQLFDTEGNAILVPEDAVAVTEADYEGVNDAVTDEQTVILEQTEGSEETEALTEEAGLKDGNEVTLQEEASEEDAAITKDKNADALAKDPGLVSAQKTDDETAVSKDQKQTYKDLISSFRRELSGLRQDGSAPENKTAVVPEEEFTGKESQKVSDEPENPALLLTDDDTSEEVSPADHTVEKVLSDSDQKLLLSLLEKNGIETKHTENGALDPKTDITELLSSIIEEISKQDNPDKKDLLSLLGSKPFANALKDAMGERWTLSPDKVADKEAIKELYAKISVDMERLSRVAQEAAKGNNPISNAADSIRSNVDFINQINQAYTYIQLPLTLSGQQATGDLYVFSNKKRKPGEDDELSAFLHFDLVHLGSTDISVKMKKKKVSTDFYMSDDESFALVQKNLPKLEEKLEKLGYTCELRVSQDEETVDFVNDFIKQGMSAGESIHRYSFDMMA